MAETPVAPRSAAHRIGIWPLTAPLTDILLLFLALPALWVLGLEQLAPFFVLALAFLKLVLTRPKLRVPLLARIWLLFVAWQIISATSIDRASNWFVFGKDFASYLASLFVYLIVVNEVKTQRQFMRLLWALVLAGLAFSTIGAVFALGLLPDTFSSLMAPVVPGFLRGSTFVQENILLREIGRSGARFGPLVYRRVSSIFLFPGAAAIALMVVIPLQVYMLTVTRKLQRLVVLLALGLALVNFVLAASRATWVTLPAAALIFAAWRWQKGRHLPRLLVPGLVALVLAMLLATAVVTSDYLLGAAQNLFVDVRSESLIDRLDVYYATFDSLAEHPIIGWGTPRAIPYVLLAPAGTHGEYIHALYSNGIVGLALYLGVYAVLWIYLLRLLLRPIPPDGRVPIFPYVAATIVLANNLNGLVHGLYFDFVPVLFFWTVIGLVFTRPAATS